MTEWMVEVMHSMGYVGIFLLLVLARVIPPVPAETVIPLAGLDELVPRDDDHAVPSAGRCSPSRPQLPWRSRVGGC